ncbi:hypothetical protein [Naiadivirus vacaense]|uniref:Capsid protein n=1 Tax=Circoviridae sp. TaxID=1954248 RepID=A0ABY4CDN0_9VIRU|nr:hypothetical protein [Circoviridae sp.]
MWQAGQKVPTITISHVPQIQCISKTSDMPSLRRFQQRWRYLRIRRGMRSIYRPAYRTARRYRVRPLARRYPTWYFNYGRYRRLRY